METRLAKALARAGISSRRKAEELIKQGLVTVNGRVITEPGTVIDPDSDVVSVDGKPICREKSVYLLLNKPAGYISSVKDDRGRKTVLDLLPDRKERLFPVGRLDYDTRGLLLLTNDGDFANLMSHPRYRIAKVYHARCRGKVAPEAINKLQQGILLDGEPTLPARVKVLRQSKQETLLEIELHEGRKRQVKRMMMEVGHPVIELMRVRFGPLDLKGVPEGKYRLLTDDEVETMRRLALGKVDSRHRQG
ncbi:MAG: rRNA pseudouridine synthase [Syntrophomonadaceae bacterium]|nr:rRNA pseudouridine synthase [Syntrophomonadaceae bacterium]